MKTTKLEIAPVRTPQQIAEHKKWRKIYREKRPSLEELIASGEFQSPVAQGAFMAVRAAVWELKKCREQSALDTKTIAKRSGLDEMVIQRLEKGDEPSPSIDLLYRYALGIGKTLLLKFEDYEPIRVSGHGESKQIVVSGNAGPVKQGQSVPMSSKKQPAGR